MTSAKQLKVSAGMEAGADLGPLISPEAKERVCSLVQSGVEEGAKVSFLLHMFFFEATACVCSLLWMAEILWYLAMRKETLWDPPFWLM